MIINVLGFGLMGKQIAALLYLTGCKVNLYSRKEIEEKDFLKQVKILKKRISTVTEGTVTFFNQISELPNCITIESIIEDIKAKKQIYQDIRKNNNSLYFTNTSSYSPLEIASDVLGLHFFNPINLGLIEAFLNDRQSDEIDNLIEKFKHLEYEVVNVDINRGYIGNYILFHEISSALKLVEKFNYNVNQINQVYSKLYDGRDIFFIIDLIGIDVVFKILNNLREEDETIYIPKILKMALDKNVLGRKNKTTIKSMINDI